METIQCYANSKAEALKNAIKNALMLDCRIIKMNAGSILFIGHTPEDKDCGNIEEWETVSCEVLLEEAKCHETSQSTGPRRTTIHEGLITSYDKGTGLFTVNIDTPVITT